MKNEELVDWANTINTVPENYQGIIFSDEMNDKFSRLDDEIKDVEDPDGELEFHIRYWKMNHSADSIVKIAALGYKYLISVMLRHKDKWQHLTPDEALNAAFGCLPISLSRYVPGKSKFLSYWANGASIAWQKATGGDK